MILLVRKYRLIAAATLVATMSFGSCRSPKSRVSKVLTDLGSDNEAVAERFNQYKAKRDHCSLVPRDKAKYRVILAGFGPFSGLEFNTSSLVAMNFSAQLDHTQAGLISPLINKDDADGIVRQDIVSIDGVKVAVCAVSASVIWDLAAAIYLHEAQNFKPDLIIMSGMDGGNPTLGTWEHHAMNVAKSMHGYERNGSQSSVTPKEPADGSDPLILPGGPEVLPMTWNAKRLVEVTSPMVRKFFTNFDVQTSDEETPGKYLCNNVSYVMLAGLAGHPLPLAGGKMSMKINGLESVRAGFFHYPWDSEQDADAVRHWSEVLAAAIKSEIFR
jgi:pyrrolidone-carboxylate peptidase